MKMIIDFLREYLCDRPSFRFANVHEIGGAELRTLLVAAFPDARIYMSDSKYKYVSHEELERWLNTDSLDKMVWLPEIWDCDNFAAESFCRAHRVIGNIAYGIGWGHTPAGYHAFNIAYTAQGVEIIEPQNDTTKHWKQSDYKPDFIKI